MRTARCRTALIMAGGQTLSAYLEPHLHRELHVYITSRTFGKNGGQLFSRLPGGIKQLATDCGFAHFMLVVEDRSVGTLHQFDFGPHGADTHISLPRLRRRKRATGVPGEVREAQLASLPEHHLYIGRTAVTLQDIRTFNRGQNLPYLLNVNDCRHYINRTVTFATGVRNHKVCPALLRHKVLHRHMAQGSSRLRWQDHLILWAHVCTDVAHWPTVQRVSQASCALLGTLAGRKLWAGAARSTSAPQQMLQAGSTRAVATKVAAAARPGLPQIAMHRAASVMVTAAQAPAACPYRVRPLVQHAARLGARASSSFKAAAASAVSSASSFQRGGSRAASGMAANAAGSFRQATSRGSTRAPPVGV